MKKFLSVFSLALCLLFGAVCFVACGGSSKLVTPEFSIQNQGYKIEFVSNAEEDVVFPIAGVKLDHAKYQENIFQYKWFIKKTENDELVGWIDAGAGHDGNVKKGFQYGYSASYNNDVLMLNGGSVVVYLKTTDLSVFDNMEMTTDVGTITKRQPISQDETNPCSAVSKHREWDSTKGENGEWVVAEGAANFVCIEYDLDLSNVEPKSVDKVNMSLNLPNLHI